MNYGYSLLLVYTAWIVWQTQSTGSTEGNLVNSKLISANPS